MIDLEPVRQEHIAGLRLAAALIWNHVEEIKQAKGWETPWAGIVCMANMARLINAKLPQEDKIVLVSQGREL